MASLADRVLDAALNIIVNEANRLDVCHTEPATYAQATSTYSVGNKTTPTIGAPADRAGGGREITVSSFTDGTITSTSTSTSDDAQFFALVDTVNSRLLATGALSSAQFVTSGNTFSLTSFKIGIPDPA